MKTIVVLVTCPTTRVAKQIADHLIRHRLAACVNILPGIESIFRWQGKVDRSREALLLIKTTAQAFARLRRAIRRLHPYEVPEILALPVAAGHHPYLTWIERSVA